MKKFLIALLFLTVALIAGLFLSLASRTRHSRQTSLPTDSSTIRKDLVTSAHAQFHWRQIESGDYRQYIANLRRIGCPEETIRDIIIADVGKLYAARRAEVLGDKPTHKPWWEPKRVASKTESNRTQDFLRELEQEKRVLIRELLGIELEDESEKYALPAGKKSWDLETLPADKRESVRLIMENFDALQQSMLEDAASDGPPDWGRLREAYKHRETELAKLLSESQLREFQLRNDEVAHTLRQHLDAFHPSEKEFQELFQAFKRHEDQFAYTDSNDENLWQQKRADLESLNVKLRDSLGDQRYSEFQRAQSFEFQNLYWLTRQYDLPEESATTIFDANRSARERLQRLQTDTALSEEQKAAGLRQLQEDLQTTIKTSLGDRAYRYFERWGNAHWLQN